MAMVAIRSMEIPFAGTRGGEAPLTWGQRSVWRWIEWLGPDETSLNLPYVLPVPSTGRPGLAEIAAALRALVERHEALRTRYPGGPDRPRQRVDRSGELTVGVHDAGSRPPDRVADELATELAGEPFRHDAQLPLRCALVTVGGRPYAVVLVVSHLAADWSALHLLAAEWTRLLTGDAPTRTAEWQPLDQAAAEAAGPVADRGVAALAYWENALRRLPRSLFDIPTSRPEPDRYLRLGIDSPGIAAAAELLAARWRVSVTTVLAVTCTTLLAILTGHDRAAVRLVCGNRREPPARDMVGKLAQDALLVLDLAGSTFAGLVAHGHAQARTAYRAGQYDPAALDRIKSRIRYRRGGAVDLLVFFNDIRLGQPWSGLPDPPTANGRVFVDFGTARAHARAFFTVEYAPDRCLLYLLVDTAYLPRETAATLLSGVESVLVRGVDEDLPLDRIAEAAGIVPIRRPADWVRVGPDWLRPDAVRAVLRHACGGGDVAVAVEPRPGGPRLTGYLPAAEAGSAQRVHAATMAALGGRSDVRAPDHYVLCAPSPGGYPPGDEPERWRALHRVAEGDGRDTTTIPDGDEGP